MSADKTSVLIFDHEMTNKKIISIAITARMLIKSTIRSGAIGTPVDTFYSSFYLLPHKILNMEIILYLLRLIARLSDDD